MPTAMTQACLRCKQQKRKCDRLLPVCSLCQRLNRSCCYSDPDGAAHPLPVPDLLDLTPANISQTLEAQVSAIIGPPPLVHAAAQAYFTTVHPWLPVISEDAYYSQLSASRTQPMQADFGLLTLSMYLVCALPVDGQVPAQTRSLYALLRSFVGMLEGLDAGNSFEMLQSRLLLSVFEMGHGLFPAAYISAGASIRAAVCLGANDAASSGRLHKTLQHPTGQADSTPQVWRGVVIANRYATLLSGKGSCPPPKPSSEADEKSAEIHDHTTPSQIDHFTRLAHASRLLEQVLAHIHETTPHHEFNTAEAFQIIKTATCFMETFSDGDAAENAILSSAMAVCRSAVMEILEFGSRVVQPDSEFCNQASVNMLKTIVEELMHGAAHLLSASSAVRTDALSVFIAQPLYKAAMIYLRNLTDADRMDLGPSVKPLRDALLLIGKRWAAAGRYIEEIDRYARQN
ncbi:fungal zn(2)-Cys(6) binuclear cluster domain-containing protein [Purpureocillium lilacinum]|uniref:Fungal zn(2)-Cys(6) binuclear cluster domain-containing protein n=1 Tax=Purpureocillium lilacinum TaxID=33203 RepID=A0A179GJ36_PURLI|nr:fungal zn(2)-Cys(6) binuclear cluster domain-containing protein [Purpureocillium lilacinum]GJN75593.1 hypothetical protein PLICBS_009697 [Purpureocillium lilacinum]